jgi:hypothetical protein
MEAMQLKVPRPKMTTKASFSRFGRWMLSRVRTGRAIIHMSVIILKADVTESETGQ